MKFLEIEKTAKTPYVRFDGKEGTLRIEGRCIPEDAKEFFQEIHECLDWYYDNCKDVLMVTISLEYFNTSAAKGLISIMNKLKKIPSKIEWLYEKDDQDMIEAGKDFEDLIEIIPFEFRMIER